MIELDLSTVVPSLSGPKRPHDRVSLTDMKKDFQECLNNKVYKVHVYLFIYLFVCLFVCLLSFSPIVINIICIFMAGGNPGDIPYMCVHHKRKLHTIAYYCILLYTIVYYCIL